MSVFEVVIAISATEGISYVEFVNYFQSPILHHDLWGNTMDAEPADSSPAPPVKAPESQPPPATDSGSDSHDAPTKQSSGLSSWAKNLKLPQPLAPTQDSSQSGNGGQSSFSRFTSGLGLRLSPKSPPSDDISNESPTTLQPGFIGTITKGIVDSSKSAVKAVQVKARHVVSQNKRRYQVGLLCC